MQIQKTAAVRWIATSRRYCAGGAAEELFYLEEDLAEGLTADLPAVLAGAASVARRSRVLSRFLVWARLRVFSRALSFGIVRLLGPQVSDLILPCCGAMRREFARIVPLTPGIATARGPSLARVCQNNSDVRPPFPAME